MAGGRGRSDQAALHRPRALLLLGLTASAGTSQRANCRSTNIGSCPVEMVPRPFNPKKDHGHLGEHSAKRPLAADVP